MKKKKKRIIVKNKKRLSLFIAIFLIVIFGGSTYIGRHISSSYNKTRVVYASSKSDNEIDKKNKKIKEKDVVNKEEKDDKKEIKNVNNQQNTVKEIANNEQNTSSQKNNKELDNKEFFKQDAFVGDSITEGFDFYEVLDSKNVFAKKGCAVISAKQFLNDMVQLNPKRTFILFGMNDLEAYESPDLFIKDYKSFISDIKTKLPNTEIYIQSILPTADWIGNEEPKLSNDNIDNYNKALLKMCSDENVNFLNIAPLLKGKENLYEEDGKHTKFDFYDIWLNYIKNNIM